MPLPVGPCKDCERRYVGCHSECDTYITFKRTREKEMATIQESKKIGEYRIIAMKRMKQKNRKKRQ